MDSEHKLIAILVAALVNAFLIIAFFVYSYECRKMSRTHVRIVKHTVEHIITGDPNNACIRLIEEEQTP